MINNKNNYTKLYGIVVLYIVLRLMTGAITVFMGGDLRNLAWNLNQDILNNLGLVILLLFGVANGLFIYDKFNKHGLVWKLILFTAGITLTIISLAVIWYVLLLFFW